MRREAQAVVLILLGAVLLKLVISGDYLNYVRSVLQPFLIATGVLLIGFGVVGFVRDWRSRAAIELSRQRVAQARIRTHGPGAVPVTADEPTTDAAEPATADGVTLAEADDHADRQHGGVGHGVGWLWVLPIFVLVLVPPPALGSFAAERGAVTVPKPAADTTFAALPGSDPVTLKVNDYARRAVWDSGHTLTGRTIRLTGFVTPHSGGTWYLTRMKVSCCAADARPYQVQVIGSTVRLPRDAWVRVTGTWAPSAATDKREAVPVLTALSIDMVNAPEQPYE